MADRNTSNNDVEFWKSETEKYKLRLEELQTEYDEFRCSSSELEAELEAELNQTSSKVNELTAIKQKLESEIHTLKEKYDTMFTENYKRISELEDKLSLSESTVNLLRNYIRELEQTNDDLERAKRAAVVSLEDFEARLNQAIERNAFLESELDEKEDLVVCVQRLKDETRDLKQELAVHDMVVVPVVGKVSTSEPASPQDNQQPTCQPADNITTKLNNSKTLSGSKSIKEPRASFGTSPSTFTQASRISALNVVGDMLRRVNALESKLSACRRASYGMIPDNYQTSHSTSNRASYSVGMVG